MKKKSKNIVPKMNGYKSFNDKFQCTPDGKVFQYEVGKTYEHSGEVELCGAGFHFCEDPLGVLNHYPPTGKFAEVEAEEVLDETESDTKRVAKRLFIKAEVSLSHLIGAGVKFILDKVDWTNAKESNTGYQSAATNTGEEGCAISIGIEGKASGNIGCWLTLAEWKLDEKTFIWHRIDVRTVRVDGGTIKPETFYMLKGGEFVAAE